MVDEQRVRHSEAEEAAVVDSDLERATREAANSLLQAERVRNCVLDALDGQPFKLRPSRILDLNRVAIDGLDAYAGNFRPAGIKIGESKHIPPEGHLVPEFVEELCDYVNENWEKRTAIHLASFVMWRLNWIHPFTDGNGRTSRATSYLVLCVKLGMLLPGSQSIPEQIVANRRPYYNALEGADRRHEALGSFPENIVEKMEELMSGMLAEQLRNTHQHANGAR
ncbi:Fic family protein [Jannaschia donghaensis]|uniref:Mobile mystery protein B n=1 Tax=Jannaschia donghaensis TaxID=420998 RepID=A0A0M6YD65_9RHOB|nr:Fic family protein [Jannaschia donghaensis]CTQ48301.1 mobile mystery protein B [Jannaschia donghaensis]